MPKSIYDRGLLRPVEIARLQRVFDETCRRREVSTVSAEAQEIARTLLVLHNAGMSDERDLLDALAFPVPERRSA